MPLNVTNANTYIENFIGAPIPRYNPSDPHIDDEQCVAIYNIYKPVIFDFFQACNNPSTEKNKAKLKLIMFMVKATYYTNANPLFFQRAANESLIPQPINGQYNADWYNKWYNMLFGEDSPEDTRLSIVIQGGEAVNFYTTYKYENVPTHDADTRVLAGNYFNYMTKVEDVDIVAKDQMHRYRFFIAFGLMAYLKTKTTLMQMNLNHLANYTSKFIPQWTQPAVVTFKTHWNNGDFYDLILSGTYGGLGNDFRIERLLGIGIQVNVGGVNHSCWVVDLMCPFKHPGNPGEVQYDTSRARVGQSDSLHTYFSTAQARSTSDDGVTAPNPDGQIPSLNFSLPLQPENPMLGDINAAINTNPIEVRMVPLGFILFETLRMLFVSKRFESNHIENKMLKYKQKLNVLLSTLMREDPSKDIYDYCLQHKARVLAAPANPPVPPLPPAYAPGNPPPLNPENNQPQQAPAVPFDRLLLGGRAEVANQQALVEAAVPLLTKMPLQETQEDTFTQARAFSRRLMALERDVDKKIVAMLKTTPLKEIRQQISSLTIPEPEEMTPVEELGYMDYLSYHSPDFKDYRLPLSKEEKEDFQPLPNIPSEILQAIQNVKTETDVDALFSMKSKGGYRKKTPRNRTKQTGRVTRRR